MGTSLRSFAHPTGFLQHPPKGGGRSWHVGAATSMVVTGFVAIVVVTGCRLSPSMYDQFNEIFDRYLRGRGDVCTDGNLLKEDDEIVITTDGYTVDPLEFPGGDIGSLSVNGTINDLAVCGAKPLLLRLNAYIERNFPVAVFERIMQSLVKTAEQGAVAVVAGSATIVPSRGDRYSGLHFATTGIGTRLPGPPLTTQRIRAGDKIVVSGPIAGHGVSVLLARETLQGFEQVRSDCANIFPVACTLLQHDGLRVMRDGRSGGLAAICHELALATGLGIQLDEVSIPIDAGVKSACSHLGIDPFHLASEGRVVAVVAAEQAAAVLAALRALPEGRDAAVVGTIGLTVAAVLLETAQGEMRHLDNLQWPPSGGFVC